MHRIDTPTRLIDANGAGKDGFRNGTAPLIPPTAMNASFFNDLQEEVCNAITNEGIALVAGTQTQLVSALDRRMMRMAIANLTQQTNGGNFDLYAIAYRPQTNADDVAFVAVGQADGVNAYMVTSPDGHQWQERSNPKNFGLNAVCYGNGLWVAVGAQDGTDSYIVTSPDGITWTERANPKNVVLLSVTYAAGVYVAVGSSDVTDAYVLSSTDGSTWTERTNPRNVTLRSVVHNGTLFVAGGQDDLTDCYLITSPDGTTWTERTTPKRASIQSIAYGNGIHVAYADASGGFGIGLFTSPDGITWTDVTAAALTANGITVGYSVVYGDGVFILLTANKDFIYSFDGAAWFKVPKPTEIFLGAVYGRSQFVFVGTEDNGAEAAIYTSLANP